MARLTNEIRDAIKRAVKAEWLKGRESERKALAGKCAAFADCVFLRLIGEKNVRAMSRMPDGFFLEKDKLEVIHEATFTASGPWRVPAVRNGDHAHWYSAYRVKVDELTPEEFAMMRALAGERREARDAESAMMNEAHALLWSVTTWKQLADVWPEGERFWGPLAPKAGGCVALARRTDTLNALLCLVPPATGEVQP